mmetsp:Transcript_15185/g.31311  ORF Transcript_15185/g.31311 Transcript_15185/m.31311 type:complete len:377 (+) Transcript_15185:1899-3029(+)
MPEHPTILLELVAAVDNTLGELLHIGTELPADGKVIVKILHGLGEEHGGPLPEREDDLLGHQRSNVWVAVPVTTNPTCELDRDGVRRHLLSQVPSHLGVELPAVSRDSVPEGRLNDGNTSLGLHLRVGLLSPNLVTAPDASNCALQLGLSLSTFKAGQLGALKLTQSFADGAVLAKDSAAVDLGRVSSQDDLNLLLQQLLENLVFGDGAELGNRSLETVLPDQLVIVQLLLSPNHAEAMVVLGNVYEVEGVGENPRHGKHLLGGHGLRDLDHLGQLRAVVVCNTTLTKLEEVAVKLENIGVLSLHYLLKHTIQVIDIVLQPTHTIKWNIPPRRGTLIETCRRDSNLINPKDCAHLCRTWCRRLSFLRLRRGTTTSY